LLIGHRSRPTEERRFKGGASLSTNDHIYRNLIVALAILFVSSPILDYLFGSATIDSFLIAGFLLFALYEITRRRADVVIGLVLGIPAVAGGIANAATPDTPMFNAVPTVLTALFLGFLVWRILKDVFAGTRMTSEQISGAVSAYLLIGLLFSSIYGFISLMDPGAFAYSDPLAAHLAADHRGQSFSVFTYFSFVTMSTLGYGDIAPVSGLARNFAWIQAVLGQLYLAITVATLVGIHIARGRN
jgi:hypothetical protein